MVYLLVQARAEALTHAFSPAFFIGTRCGSLYYADDIGHTTEVQALGARIDHMLFFEAKSRLVILTRALVLVQLQIGSDCKVIPVMKMKVAVAGGAAERGIKHICWAGPGVVAAATGEVPRPSRVDGPGQRQYDFATIGIDPLLESYK